MEIDSPGTSRDEFKITKTLLETFENQLGMSGRQVKKVKKILKKQGAKTSETYLDTKLAEGRHELDQFFEYKSFSFKLKTVYDEDDEEEKQLRKLEKRLAKDRAKQQKFELYLSSENVDDSAADTEELDSEEGIEENVEVEPVETQRTCVICSDINGLVNYLISKRELDENCKLQLGIDGMYEFMFHVYLSIFRNSKYSMKKYPCLF